MFFFKSKWFKIQLEVRRGGESLRLLREFWEWWQLLLKPVCDWWSVSIADSRDKGRGRGWGVMADQVELIHPFLTPWNHPSSCTQTLQTPTTSISAPQQLCGAAGHKEDEAQIPETEELNGQSLETFDTLGFYHLNLFMVYLFFILEISYI